MRTRSGAVAVAAVMLLAGLIAAPAQAKPGDPAYPTQAQVDRARDEVSAREARLDEARAALSATSHRLAIAHATATEASEAYGAARWALEQARAEARRTKKKAVVARLRVDEQRRGIGQLVAQTYQLGGGFDQVTTFLTSGSPETIMDRQAVLQGASLAMKLRLDAFHGLSREAVKAESRARKARAKADRLEKEAEVAREMADLSARAADSAQARFSALEREFGAELAEAKDITRKLKKQRDDALEALHDGDETTLVAPQPRIDIPWLGRKADKPVEVPRTYPVPVDDPPAPDEEGAAKAIAFAEEQIGDMYLWAATGPDRWDCSGLTQAAWNQGGGNLVHYSEAQYLQSIPIRATDLAPGDLVFWQDGQVRIHHVALYVGEGKILHAPRSGQPVQVVEMGDFQAPDFFARPRT